MSNAKKLTLVIILAFILSMSAAFSNALEPPTIYYTTKDGNTEIIFPEKHWGFVDYYHEQEPRETKMIYFWVNYDEAFIVWGDSDGQCFGVQIIDIDKIGTDSWGLCKFVGWPVELECETATKEIGKRLDKGKD